MAEISPRRKALFASFLVLGAVALSVLTGEIYVRVFSEYGYDTPRLRKERALKYVPSQFARHVFPREPRTVRLGRGESTHYVEINSLGYRGRDFETTKPPGVVRVIVFGGSAVFDPEAPEGEDWPHRVEQILRDSGVPQIEVINAGIPGHAGFDSFGRFFSEAHAFEPDYVILYNAWNDIKGFRSDEPLLRQRRPMVESADPRLDYRNWLDRLLCETSQLYTRLRGRYYNWKLQAGSEGVAPEGEYTAKIADLALRQYRLNIELFVDTARNIGVVPILMTQARLPTMGSTEEQKSRIAYKYTRLTHEAVVRAFRLTDEIIHSVAETKGVTVIDAAPILSGRDDMLYDHVHLTERGSEELARLTAEHLRSLMSSRVATAGDVGQN